MDLPDVSKPPWGFVEWVVTGLATSAATAFALLWRLVTRLERMSLAIERQRADFEVEKRTSHGAFLGMVGSLAQLKEDHSRMRESIGGLPTRSDLRDVEDHIGERIETLAARFDRALEKRGI
jgi:hypothetical protein